MVILVHSTTTFLVVVFVKLTHLFEIKHYGYIRGIIALIIKMETFDIELSGRLAFL
jgi:hypothetical protein